MIPRDVKSPTAPIPFDKLLRVVAIVDPNNEQTKELLDHIKAEGFQIEICEGFDRDVSEDADVGAYIALVDGDRLEKARKLGRSVRAIGFQTPLWALADSHRISDLAVLSLTGEVDGYIYLGQQTPAFYAKQVIASLLKYGKTMLPPFFGGLMAYDREANIAFDCPGHQGGQFYRKSPAGQLFFKHFGESIFRNDLCNADVDLGDLLIHEGPAVEAQRHAAKVFGADKTYFVLNGTSTSNKVVTNAVLRCGDLVLFDRNKQIPAPRRVSPGRCHPDLSAHITQRLRHDRCRRLGCLGRGLSPRSDSEKPSRQRFRTIQGRAPISARLHPARDL